MTQEELSDQIEWFLENRVNAIDLKTLTLYMAEDGLDVAQAVSKTYSSAELKQLIESGEFTDIVKETVKRDFTYKMAKWLHDKGYEIILPETP